jgi:hypothetical protein
VGVSRVSELPGALVDALVVLKSGDISHVIESELGYHLIKRLDVPTDSPYSAGEIVIMHRELAGSLPFSNSP